jgi:predicted RNA-binding protein with PUA-like domain
LWSGFVFGKQGLPSFGGQVPRQYWLLKSEPESFSIADLERAPGRTTGWEGVRNYQARNYLRLMRRGDGVLFYHSNAEPPAVAGLAEVVAEAYADPTALDRKSTYFDPKATAINPRWSQVDIRHVQTFARPIPLERLRGEPALSKMELLRKGSRLSVQKVRPEEWKAVLALSKKKV